MARGYESDRARRRPEVRILKRASFAEQDAALDQIIHTYKVSRLWMDQTGMGEKPVEDACRRYGASRVDGVLMTSARKLDIASAGKACFEDRKLRIPAGDMALRSDLHKPQRVVGPSGLLRFIAERDADGHADRFWALMLACAAADVAPRQYGYTPAPLKHPFSQVRDPFSRPADDDDMSLGSRLKSRWRGWCAMIPRPAFRSSALHRIWVPETSQNFPFGSRLVPENPG